MGLEVEKVDLENHLRAGLALYSEAEVGLPLKHIPRSLAMPIQTIIILFSFLTFILAALFTLIVRYEKRSKTPKKSSQRKRMQISLDEENTYAGKLSLLEKLEKKMLDQA